MSGIERLSTILLPEEVGLKRDLPLRAEKPDSSIWNFYDRTTLVYDAVYLPDLGCVRLFVPRLLNLEHLVTGARFCIGADLVKVTRHRVFRRFETIDFQIGHSEPRFLTIELPSVGQFEMPINREDSDPFKGRRVIYTLQKDQRLEWIRDWMVFHNKVQGADAVLIADNGSSSYSASDLLSMMEGVPGYSIRKVLSVPLPWGPRGGGRGVDDGKYLQTTLLNLVRDRFLRSAYAVLNVDIDELVIGHGASTVFDSAQRWGYVTFPGQWRYSQMGANIPWHYGHVYLNPSDSECATKYCFKPASWLGRRCLSVHSLENINRKLFSGRKKFMFLHCRNISTSWKFDRIVDAMPNMLKDDLAERKFREAFGTSDNQALQ